MAFKDILVHVDDTGELPARIDTAVDLAGRHGARLSGLYVRPSIDLPHIARNVSAVSLQEMLEQSASRAAADARAVFEDRVARTAADRRPDSRWLEDSGEAAEAIVTRARVSDLVVIGPGDGDRSSHLPNQVILSAGIPALVVPHRLTRDSIGERILIAWNGSREVVRSVHAALPILRQAQAVEIMVVLAREPDAATEQPGTQLAEYLALHGVNAGVKVLLLDDPYGVRGKILARTEAIGADLIVMGGFGQSWLREATVGSTTGSLLSQVTVPLFVSH